MITATVPESVAITDVVEPEAPTEEPSEEPIEEPFTWGMGMVPAAAFSIEFCYPSQYSNGFSQAMLLENPPDGEMPIWGINPDMIEITLAGYPVANEYHAPIIRIYPVDDFSPWSLTSKRWSMNYRPCWPAAQPIQSPFHLCPSSTPLK